MSQGLGKLGSDILRTLLRGSDPNSPWGLRPDSADDAPKICRGVAHLVEAVAWLGCQEEVFPHLEPVTRYLQHHSARDPDHVATSASRLKALILCAAADQTRYEEKSLVSSIQHLASIPMGDLRTRSFDLLCLADLCGSHLHHARKARTVDQPVPWLDHRLVASVETRYKELVDDISDLVRDSRDELGARPFAFAVWLLFLAGRYESEGDSGQLSAQFKEDIDALVRAAERNRPFGHYRARTFLDIAYPRVTLAWFHRKGLCAQDPRDFYSWLLSEIPPLLDHNPDPAHLGVALKACIAGAKGDVRRAFRQAAVVSAVAADRSEAQMVSTATRSLVGRIIRKSIEVNIRRLEKLSGGWSSASLLRVSGNYRLPLVDTAGRRDGGVDHEFSFVVKMGPRQEFLRAASLYASLDESCKRLFPSHDGRPDALLGEAGPTFFLIMEELQQHLAIGSRLLALLPEDDTQASRSEEVTRMLRLGLRAIQDLHVQRVPVGIGQSTSRDYFMKIANCYETLDALVRKYERARRLTRTELMLTVGGGERTRVRPPYSVLPLLMGRAGRPRPKGSEQWHVLSHGDCHAHNIMVRSVTWDDPRFVDIDGLRVDDYLSDYADFVAHVGYSLPLESIDDDSVIVQVDDQGEKPMVVVGPEARLESAVAEEARRLCAAAVAQQHAERHDVSHGAIRYLTLIARRLFFVASKAPTENKAIVLMLLGSRLLTDAFELKTAHR